MSDLFNTGIRPVVDAYLQKKSEEERNYGNYWSASSAGYCMRLNIMRRLKVPPVPEIADSAARTRVFESGHIFHEWMQRITKNAGISIAQEVELQDEELMIRGHFDDLVLVNGMTHFEEEEQGGVSAQEKHLILYDYKTAHSASFKYAKGRPISRYHKMQLATYMYMLRNRHLDYNPAHGDGRWISTDDLAEARILSISKDDLRMDEKQLMWSEALQKEIVGYWSTLNGYWKAYQEKGVLPACTCLDFEGGFLGKRSAKGKIYNDFFWKDEPCSQVWFDKWKAENAVA